MKRVWLAGILLLLILAAALSYANRTTIAENIGERWCKSRGLTCTVKVTELSIHRISLSDMKVTKNNAPTILSASNVVLDLSWPSGLMPVLTRAKITEPMIRASYDGQTVSLYGLEDAFSGSSGSAETKIPELDITGGTIQLETPAGKLSGTFDATGNWPQSAQVSATIAPANLVSGEQVLTLGAAQLEIAANNGTYSGRVYVDLPRLAFETARMDSILAEATFIPGTAPRIDWNAKIGEISVIDQLEIIDAGANGIIELRSMPDNRAFDMMALIKQFGAQGKTARFDVGSIKAASTAFDISGAISSDTRLTFETKIDALALESAIANVTETNLNFEGELNPKTGALRGTGDIVATNVNLAPPLRKAVLAPLSALEETSSHATSLNLSLKKALTNFTTGGGFQIDYDPSGVWQIIVAEKIALRSASGLNLLLSPSAQQTAIVADQSQIEIKGLLAVDGGGAPTLRTDIRSLKLSGDETSLTTGGLTLSTWKPGPTSIAAKLNRFAFTQRGETLRASGLGELTMSGRVLGVEVGQTRVFGGIDAASGREGWRVQTTDTPCIGLELGSLKTGGGIQLTPTSLTICPEDQRFIRQENGRATGRIALGDITLPFQGNDVSGSAQLTAAKLVWSYQDRLQFDLSATRIFVPLRIGDRTLNIATTSPIIDIILADTTQFTARVSNTTLSGQLVPANVTIGSGNFEGRLISQGFTGQASATDVRISDINADPIYRPLLSTLNATFDGTRMSLSGPVRLAANGVKVAQVGFNMDLLTLDGTGFVTSETLEFRPKGLQPKDLSDRARGLLSNGRGSLAGRADLLIRSGNLSGTGQITARDFGFDTLRIGAVDGVNGTINFSDLLDVTTPSGQQVSIAKLNPGIPLNNGELSFQILGGQQANIEAATWPFAGGILRALPTKWTIAGTSDIITVEADKIELSQLIETLSLPDIEAEGTVSGTFPIELQGGNAFVRNARLVADSKGGVIRYKGNALPETQGRDQDNVTQAAFKALRNLRYSVLELGVNGNLIGDIVVSVKVLGKNPDVLGGAEFSFNIAVDSKLAQLIQTGRGLMSSDVITETTINEIKRLREERQ